MSKVNDFVVRFSNVNGTGSASANLLFARSIFRMGIPVSPKNIFPSNIQGLPTWYEVRINENGYLGRREGVDLTVCVNPESMAQDVKEVQSGGYLLYDSTKPLHDEFIRDDINYIAIPLMQLSAAAFTDPRQRQLFKNIIYVGALAALLDIEFDVIVALLNEQFSNKQKLIDANIQALNIGVDYVKQNLNHPLDIRLERRDNVGDMIFIDGNKACGLGAIYAGATVLAWYPITPSTSVAEAFENYAKKLRIDPETGASKYAVVQAEDELAAIGMVIGANWNGSRSFTSTSGPGLSLMNEFLGLAYFAEIPAVLIDVQRSGPSTGMPTRTQQSDVLAAAYASHGDTKQILLFPSTPTECFDLTAISFDLADRLQTPVIVLSDLDLGMNDHLTAPLKWDDNRKFDKGKVYSFQDLEEIKSFGRYRDVDDDGIPYRTYPGTHPTKGSYFTRGSSKNEEAAYTENEAEYKKNMDRLLKKWETARNIVPAPVFSQKENNSSDALLFYGTTNYSAIEALDLMSKDGMQLDAIRILSFPFNKEVEKFIEDHERIFVIEQNRDAQMKTLLVKELCVPQTKLISILNYDGIPITADLIIKGISSHLVLNNS